MTSQSAAFPAIQTPIAAQTYHATRSGPVACQLFVQMPRFSLTVVRTIRPVPRGSVVLSKLAIGTVSLMMEMIRPVIVMMVPLVVMRVASTVAAPVRAAKQVRLVTRIQIVCPSAAKTALVYKVFAMTVLRTVMRVM